MKALGVVLILLGIGSAVLGVVNVVQTLEELGPGSTALGARFRTVGVQAELVTTWSWLIVPGLLLIGVGTLLESQAGTGAVAIPSSASNERSAVTQDDSKELT